MLGSWVALAKLALFLSKWGSIAFFLSFKRDNYTGLCFFLAFVLADI